MSLIQIIDPDEKKSQIVVGIDFGTTNSLIAFSINQQAFIIDDANGNIASRVSFIDGRWQPNSSLDGLSISSIKRILGTTYQQIIQQKAIDPQIKALLVEENGAPMLKIDNKLFNPIELASSILSSLKQVAEKKLRQSVDKAVLSVPAYFDDKQKMAVKTAAKIAGLDVIRLINEPTAAGFAYNINYDQENGQYVVYDFGGGTFDVSLLKINDKITQVLSVKGDNMLGGDDIDHKISNYLSTKYQQNIDLSIAKSLKHQLCHEQVAQIQLKSALISLSLNELNSIAIEFVEKTITLTRQVVEQGENIKGIILVGGSSRLILVKQMLASFNIALLDSIDPDKAVAFGAALQAENLSRAKSHLLIDVVALSLGLELMGGLAEKIIMRNTPMPVYVKRYFTTSIDNQTAIKLNIVQGEREFAADCRSLSVFELSNIKPMPAGLAKIEVTFSVDADGLLHVEACEVSSGVRSELLITTDSELSQLQIYELIQQAMLHAKDDHENKMLKEQSLAGEKFISQVEQIMQKLDLKQIETFEQQKINTAIDHLKDALSKKSIKEIKQAIEELDEHFSPICAKYFNQQISDLLKGSKID